MLFSVDFLHRFVIFAVGALRDVDVDLGVDVDVQQA